MSRPATFPTSSPALDQWRPTGDRLSYSDAAWAGAAWGVAMHAALHFFSVAIPALEPLLVVFGPAERFAYAITQNADPLATWLMLLASQGVFWALVGVGLLQAVHRVTDLVFAGRRPAPVPDRYETDGHGYALGVTTDGDAR